MNEEKLRHRYEMLDLTSEFDATRSELTSAIEATMQAGTFVLGPQVAAFERAFAHYIGAEDVVGVASGTDALVLSLKAAGIGESQEVITTPFTFVATVEAIMRVGARPVLADIDPRSLNLDPAAAAAVVDANTSAIIAVHLFGNPSGLTGLERLCSASGLTLVEDAAQGVGAYSAGWAAGTVGQFGAYSFHPTKTLGAAGDAGAVACSSTAADMIRELRNHGSVDKVSFRRRGLNSRLDELQATILQVKLTRLADRVRARQHNAEIYLAHFEGLPIESPVVTDDLGVHGYNYFTLQANDRDALASHLESRGIATAVYYRTPIHLLEAYRDLGYAAGDFPVAERASRRALSLPCHPLLTAADIAEIADAVREYYQ